MPLDDLPAPKTVASRCARRAWKDNLTDKDRFLLEAAADTIRMLIDRNLELARRAEKFEADAERFWRALGQKRESL